MAVSLSLENKTAIITGAGKGIGLAIAETFAEAGARVILFDLDEESGEEAAVAIRETGARATFVKTDVSDQGSVKASLATALTTHDRIDILVNNAGIAHIGTAVTTEEEDFDRVLRVNVKGVYNCLHLVLPHLIQKGGGVVLNMSSVASVAGLPDRFAYSTSKGAVHTMTLAVAADHLKDKIRCNCICPARVHTPFVDGYLDKNYPDNRDEMFQKLSEAQPVGRMAQPSEIAKLALYLCSEDADFITGQAYEIDGGYMNLRD
ncbi:MAG: SDR family oxidoreductase [Verrucomicrobiales bacterium]|nr:SDR family oxidoreductase [Verrucomicrobiales bacterium]